MMGFPTSNSRETSISTHNRNIPSTSRSLLPMFLISLLLLPTSSNALVANPTQSTTPKVGRVAAGPIEISAMGCGTWSWGNRLLWDYDPSQDEEIYQAYSAVRTAGVSLFDTADSYGTLDLNGRAEILLGEFERRYLMERAEGSELEELERSKGDNMFSQLNSFFNAGAEKDLKYIESQQVATKFAPYPWRIRRSDMVNAAKSSLKRLYPNDDDDNKKLTLAQLHWSTANYQPFQEKSLWEGISDVYDANLCTAIGVSNYGPLQLNKLSNYLRTERPDVPLATSQIQYSLMTYKDLGGDDIVQSCEDAGGCRLISYSPLCLGLLTGKYDLDNLPKNGNPRRQLFRELLPGAKKLLDTLEVMAEDTGKSQSQVAINWTMCKGTVPIPGARTLKQAEENLGAIGWKLDDGMVEELDRAALGIGKPMIQNIFQTK